MGACTLGYPSEMSRKVEIVMPTDQNLSATELIESSKEIAPFSVLYSVSPPCQPQSTGL